MDPLTHVMTGLAMSRAGLSRWHPQAPLLLMTAAELPDIDIVSLAGGPWSYFLHHRGITHTFAAAPVLALGIALLFCAGQRSWKYFRAGFILALLGLISHLLLDWTNAYGIRLLNPFSAHWYSLDITDVVDVWIATVLLIATFGPLMGRMVSAEMGSKPGTGRGLAIFALLFLCAYNGGRSLVHQRAVETLEARIYDGGAPLRAGAFPTLFNPLAWDGIVDGAVSVRKYRLNLSAPFDPDGGARYEKPEMSPAIQAASKTDMFRKFLSFAKYPLWMVVPSAAADNSVEVRVVDLRFGFSVSAVVDAANRVHDTKFNFR
jgi:inner membrane protein